MSETLNSDDTNTNTNTNTDVADDSIVDRSTLTLLEHVNLNVPSQEYIMPFYFDLLGCGLDPRKAANLQPGAPKQTIWANCGASQFHLPFGDVAQRIPGHMGLRYDSLGGLKSRVAASTDESTSSKSNSNKALQSYEIGVDPRTKREFVKLVDMYDNVFYCREKTSDSSSAAQNNEEKRQPIISPNETDEWGDVATKYGRHESECRGIDYVEFLCPKGTADKIATFYDTVFDATTTCVSVDQDLKIAIIGLGNIDEHGKADQSLLFRETTTTEAMPKYDGHHIAMYVGECAADFEQAYKNAEIAGVVWCNPRFSDKADTLRGAREWKQFRFKNIVDMKTGEPIFELEHEMRSIEHESWPGKR